MKTNPKRESKSTARSSDARAKNRNAQPAPQPPRPRPVPEREEPQEEGEEEEGEEEPETELVVTGKDPTIYCICRQSYSHSEFMISCDRCGDWFHGRCIGMTEWFSRHIDIYHCRRCALRANLPQVRFNTEYMKELSRIMKIIYSDKQMDEERTVYRCDLCVACLRQKRCNRCDPCNRAVPGLCLKMRCVHLSSHPTMIRGKHLREITKHFTEEEYAKLIKPALLTAVATAAAAAYETKSTGADNSTVVTAASCAVHKFAIANSGRKKWKKGSPFVPFQIKSLEHIIQEEEDREVEEAEKKEVLLAEMDVFHEEAQKKQEAQRQLEQRREVQMWERKSKPDKTKKVRRKRRVKTEEDAEVSEVEIPKQCMEPSCVKLARVDSKYCTEECGLKLAQTRLRCILPTRVENFWSTTPTTHVRFKKWIEELTEICTINNDRINELLSYYQMVMRYINALHNLEPMDEDEDVAQDMISNCTVCGAEVNARQLPKHVERCFVRSEKQITFGAQQMAAFNPHELFCESYNKASNTFCKRLRVMCAEHYKGELEEGIKICGCPYYLTGNNMKAFSDIFIGESELLEGGFCTNPRKTCTLHHRWIQTVFGIIETERMNLLTKFEELSERRTALMTANRDRGDLISLLCCETKRVNNDQEPKKDI
ncbi:unnamed protein product [Auanema sp. JU1783]|nr:unnamed protein product [Auanema sp. JU1783]